MIPNGDLTAAGCISCLRLRDAQIRHRQVVITEFSRCLRLGERGLRWNHFADAFRLARDEARFGNRVFMFPEIMAPIGTTLTCGPNSYSMVPG